jgi:LAS superfamily LD-carboxypeptidase LdcB
MIPVLVVVLVGACTAASGTGSRLDAARSPSPAATSPSTTPSPEPSPTVEPVEHLTVEARKGFDSPIGPDNRPNAIVGDVNGEMPSRDLVGVAPDCLAARAAAPSLGLLLATARNDGVVLGTAQCYRPLADQVSVKSKWTAAGNSSCAATVLTAPTGKPVGTSMHGWGKAADFSGDTEHFTTATAGYQFLVANAGRFGWNHPGWARPGGSVCPEAWHWEWLGDGGRDHLSKVRADVVTLLPSSGGQGYWIVTGLGAVWAHGDAEGLGSLNKESLAWLVTGAARTPDGGGYWLVSVDGSVHAFGDAKDLGSAGDGKATRPFVGIAAAPDGAGYWLATADGGVFAFGSAGFHGSPAASSKHLARPIVAIAATPDGQGYWLAAADGKIFAYGDAATYGDASSKRLRAPIVSMASTPDGHGYWLAGADGRVFAYGEALALGPTKGTSLPEPVVGIAATSSGQGYWLVAADGSVFTLGDATSDR